MNFPLCPIIELHVVIVAGDGPSVPVVKLATSSIASRSSSSLSYSTFQS
jgi:hypothetical protein